MNQSLAVSVERINKKYGKHEIFHNLSMKVEKGSIYGLLGASGCGKTTLLGCIIGRKIIDSGEIQVFGKTPGSKGSGVPGSRIGYMPQDVALVSEYTVKESIFYFGRIANMKDSEVKRRFDELSLLLDLPPEHQFITECSGGQQRRISLAAAIVHQPQLLLLDEPTVGVDAILRDKIWNHFLDLVTLQGISVLMTTHYIEECKDANRVGLMRNGKLLAEDSPNHILALYQVDTLEEAFLNMCVKNEQGQLNDLIDENQHAVPLVDKCSTSSSVQSLSMGYRSTEELLNKDPEMKTTLGINGRIMHAVLDKNVKQFYRNTIGLVLFCVVPILQVAVCLVAVGGPIRDLKLAIINEEMSQLVCQNYDRNLTVTPNPEIYDCQFTNMSCRFLEYLDNPMISKVFYNSLTKAKEGILHGEHVGVLYIAPNFTKSYQARVNDIISVDESSLQMGQIQVYLDMSSRDTGGALKYKLIELFLDFQEDLYSDCMWNKRLGNIPIHADYLYGKESDSYLLFFIPGLVISGAFFFSAVMTTHIIVSEKYEGVWDRSLSAGVSTLEIILGHLLLQMLLLVYQCVTPIALCLYVYGMEYHGHFADIIITTILQGICGLTFGLWISVESKSHTQAHIFINGILYPSCLLSGMMWPIEGLPTGVRIMAKCLPLTLPIQALRYIIRKGWPLWNLTIISYNAVPVIWIVFFITISLLRLKKHS